MLRDLTYKVIVIDDDEDLYEDYEEFIREKLESDGYILDCRRYEELSDLEVNPINDVDLFLVDLKFGNDDKGPEFIQKIRENQFTDILFYSSDSKTIQDLRKSGEYQGVFFATRDEHTNEIYPMIDQLIQKMIMRSNTPLASRGIILGCVAELDNVVKDKIESLVQNIPEEKKECLLDRCTKHFFESYKSASNKQEAIWGCTFYKELKIWSEVKEEYTPYDLVELVKNVKVTDSNKNLNVLLKSYECAKGKDDTYDKLKSFEDILTYRNIFAHVKEELHDGKYRFKNIRDDEYVVLSEEKCRELRKMIKDYHDRIKTL